MNVNLSPAPHEEMPRVHRAEVDAVVLRPVDQIVMKLQAHSAKVRAVVRVGEIAVRDLPVVVARMREDLELAAIVANECRVRVQSRDVAIRPTGIRSLAGVGAEQPRRTTAVQSAAMQLERPRRACSHAVRAAPNRDVVELDVLGPVEDDRIVAGSANRQVLHSDVCRSVDQQRHRPKRDDQRQLRGSVSPL